MISDVAVLLVYQITSSLFFSNIASDYSKRSGKELTVLVVSSMRIKYL